LKYQTDVALMSGGMRDVLDCLSPPFPRVFGRDRQLQRAMWFFRSHWARGVRLFHPAEHAA